MTNETVEKNARRQ